VESLDRPLRASTRANACLGFIPYMILAPVLRYTIHPLGSFVKTFTVSDF